MDRESNIFQFQLRPFITISNIILIFLLFDIYDHFTTTYYCCGFVNEAIQTLFLLRSYMVGNIQYIGLSRVKIKFRKFQLFVDSLIYQLFFFPIVCRFSKFINVLVFIYSTSQMELSFLQLSITIIKVRRIMKTKRLFGCSRAT